MVAPTPAPGPSSSHRLPGTTVVRPTADEVIDALADELLIHATNCVRAFGDFHLALSGGSTPMPLYRRLMIDPRYRELPWRRTHLWIVDERCVPFDHEKSNFRQIDEILVQHAGIPADRVHPMMVLRDDADAAYERALREALAWREKGQDRLDFVLLGMGDDGHTASLFPRSPALELADDPSRLVLKNAGPRVIPPDRLTMTFYLINAARFVAVLCVGEKKKSMLRRVAAGVDPVADLPILGVRPRAGELRWYLDEAADPA